MNLIWNQILRNVKTVKNAMTTSLKLSESDLKEMDFRIRL
jgi:hypothetical protein